MADPITLTAAVGMGAAAGGGILGAIGSSYSGSAQQKSFAYQAGVAQINKQIQLQNAAYEREVGEVQAQTQGLKTRAQIGTTKAIQGASNLDVNRGSNVAVQNSELMIGQHDQATIRANAARRAYGYEVGAVESEAKSRLDMMAGTNAARAGRIGAASSILGAVSSVSSKWLQGSSAGVFGGSANVGGDA